MIERGTASAVSTKDELLQRDDGDEDDEYDALMEETDNDNQCDKSRTKKTNTKKKGRGHRPKKKRRE